MKIFQRMSLAVCIAIVTGGLGIIASDVYAKKTQWCMVDKKSGDYTSDCFKTREECQRAASKKGMTCGVNYT